jgi:UDP-glucose 4-epimerase
VKYLLTGGAGFIGSHLSEKLVSMGNQVVILDNLSTGDKNNISSFSNSFDFYEGSILDEGLVDKLVASSDYVVHLAAALGVLNIVNKPLESIITNVRGTEIVLASANKHKKPILITSTSEIYGKNTKEFLSEDDDRLLGHPLKSRWSYSEAKAIDESLGYFYYQEKGLPVRLVRLFNTVGPRQVGKYGMVLPRFIGFALKGNNLPVYGSGDQIRCFCHVSDVINALILVMKSEGTIGKVLNVGNNQQISIMSLAKKVIEITKSSSKIIQVPYSEAYSAGFEDIQRRVPDISRIKKIVGWTPEVELEQIIRDIADYLRS